MLFTWNKLTSTLLFVLTLSDLTFGRCPQKKPSTSQEAENPTPNDIEDDKNVVTTENAQNFSTTGMDFLTPEPKPVFADYDDQEMNVTNMTWNPITGRAACECGRSNSRIVGGVEANINEYPWTVALTRGGSSRPYCGGTLINNLYVLTASHCVDGMSQQGIVALLNAGRLLQSPSAQKYPVIRVTMHESYDRRTVNNDMALLRLNRPVPLSTTSPVIPVCLPASNAIDFSGFQATVAGWGAQSQGGSVASSLRKVTVPVLTNAQCNRDSKYKGRITENMLCAGLLQTGGKDSCQGDSGGPLVIENGGRRTLIGVVSWGFGCAQAQAPGVYARVGRYPDWILKNTRDADWCQG